MAQETPLDLGLSALADRRWKAAHAGLAQADLIEPLSAEHLSAMAHAAYLSGDSDACVDALARAFTAYVERGATDKAAGCAYWLAFALLNRGELAQANGWVFRAIKLLDDDGRECVERGYLEMLLAIQKLMQGDAASALEAMDRAAEASKQYADADLLGLSGLGRGQALIALERTEEGLDLLDEVMVLATAGELSETVAGLAYCAIISTCQDIFDVRRAREWTDALTRWCADQPDLVPYSGHCLVHRSEIRQLHGDWAGAAEAARAAHQRYALAQDWPAEGLAFYRDGELHRLHGDLAAAEVAFVEASRRGHDPQPGLTLLRLAQGDHGAARGSVERMLQEPLDRLRRAHVLAVHVEVSLATGDVDAAATSSAELGEIAERFAPSMLRAVAWGALGAVDLARGDPGESLHHLRRAAAIWQELEAPYELARTRELIGRACETLGDAGSARLELDAAAETYRALGAAPDLRRVSGGGRPAATADSALSPRELEVLRLVASGRTNRAIASELVLSEKTVARHVSNIFLKLDLSSRSAATAYAYEHDLV